MKHLPPKPGRLNFMLISQGMMGQMNCNQDVILARDFDFWYAEHIEKLFENAVEVECSKTIGNHEGSWYASENGVHPKSHKALLINIQPIKEEDEGYKLLQEMIDYFKRFRDLDCCIEGIWSKRAKEFLDRKEKK